MVDSPAHDSLLVGVDGSPNALHAARWAAWEADWRHVPVRLLHACALPSAPVDFSTLVSEGAVKALIEQGDRWLRQAERAVHDLAPLVEVRREVRVGGAAGLLIEESRSARLVVLGSRGLGGFKEMLVGSVAVGVAAHGHCPVIVVRGRTVADPPPERGPVVVGVDGSPVSDAAVAFAFDEASLRRVPLIAVHTWTDATIGELWYPLELDVDLEEIADGERRLLAGKMTGWREKYPDVDLRQRVVQDRPLRGLLKEAEGAQLLVVGSRGRGGCAAEMGLGSTSQALLHHSVCTVAVVRSPSP